MRLATVLLTALALLAGCSNGGAPPSNETMTLDELYTRSADVMELAIAINQVDLGREQRMVIADFQRIELELVAARDYLWSRTLSDAGASCERWRFVQGEAADWLGLLARVWQGGSYDLEGDIEEIRRAASLKLDESFAFQIACAKAW
jgi:hypothetical protein